MHKDVVKENICLSTNKEFIQKNNEKLMNDISHGETIYQERMKRVPEIMQNVLREKKSEIASRKSEIEENKSKQKFNLKFHSTIVNAVEALFPISTCEICEGEISSF